MNDTLYQQFLDWMRHTDTEVRLLVRHPSGVLVEVARGVRPRSVFEEHDAMLRTVKTTALLETVHSLGFLRKRYGAKVDAFLATLGSVGA